MYVFHLSSFMPHTYTQIQMSERSDCGSSYATSSSFCLTAVPSVFTDSNSHLHPLTTTASPFSISSKQHLHQQLHPAFASQQASLTLTTLSTPRTNIDLNHQPPQTFLPSFNYPRSLFSVVENNYNLYNRREEER